MSMQHRRAKKHEDGDEEAWLITYADMVTLLLCFFVIMFSLSSPDGKKFEKMAHAMSGLKITDRMPDSRDPTNDLREQIEMALGESGYDKFIAVSKNERFVSMELASDSFFEAGAASFSPKGEEILKTVAKQVVPLADKQMQIEVEGHTDSSPIASAKFPSNWELSGARASSVVRYLIAQGFPADKLRAVGYADTKPKAPDVDTAGKAIPANQELNRRVVIKLVRADDDLR